MREREGEPVDRMSEDIHDKVIRLVTCKLYTQITIPSPFIIESPPHGFTKFFLTRICINDARFIIRLLFFSSLYHVLSLFLFFSPLGKKLHSSLHRTLEKFT